MNNGISLVQQKREQFALNMKRIDRDTLFANNRRKMMQNQTENEIDKLLQNLNGAITIYNRKDIKSYFKQLQEYPQFSTFQEIKLTQLISALFSLKFEDDLSAIHNDCLIILVKLSLNKKSVQEVFTLIPLLIKLIEKYNNSINQSVAFLMIDKILAFIGNISCNDGFISAFDFKLTDVLINLILNGQKRLLFQSLWTLNNILFALHNETNLLKKVIIQIGTSDAPKYLIQYMKKNEIKLDKNQLISLYWFIAELSQVISFDIGEFELKSDMCEEFKLIILFIYANLTGQQVIPKYCNSDQLIELFFNSSGLIQRHILVILSNLVMITNIDVDRLKSLINYSFPICPIDSMFLLHNCQQKYKFTLNKQEQEAIFRIVQELQADPIMDSLIQQLKIQQ